MVGLLLYGSARRMGEPDSGSVTAMLPAPTRNGASVTNLPLPTCCGPCRRRKLQRRNAERPFVGEADTPASRFVLRTDPEDRSRAITCLAQAVYYEAAGEGSEGQRAVAQVVLNRLHHPGFPSTVCGVVYQGGDRVTGCQFSFVCDGSMQRIPSAWLWARSREIAEEALSGKVYAPVGHATHYHADYVLPYWADSLDKSAQLGHHIFYRLRSIFGEGRAFSQRYAGSEPEIKVPGAAIADSAGAVTPQWANALIGDGVQGIAKDIEKAVAPPGTSTTGRFRRAGPCSPTGQMLLKNRASRNLLANVLPPQTESSLGPCGRTTYVLRSTRQAAEYGLYAKASRRFPSKRSAKKSGPAFAGPLQLATQSST